MDLNDVLSKKPFVIAEVGSNHQGLEDCIKSIQLAAACGADAVKFQLFSHKALYGFDGPELTGTIDPAWLPRLDQKCSAHNIEFMCSAFSPELLDIVNQYVNIHKLASSEMMHFEMLEKLKSYGKPVIISTGGHSDSDIVTVAKHTEELQRVFMYCVPDYPATNVELRNINRIKALTNTQAGYSCHSTDVSQLTYDAVHTYGAVVIEKHVNFVGAISPDAPHSLSTAQFQKMMHALGKSKSNGSLPNSPDMQLKHKRRIIAIKDLKEGDTLALNENYGIFRSRVDDTHAAHPLAYMMINGQKLKTDVKQGQGISINHIVH